MTEPYEEWERTFRVEAITPAEPDYPGWLAYDLTLRPTDKRGRVNGRTKTLTTLKVGGPVSDVDLGPLAVGLKATFQVAAGPSPTIRSTLHPR